MSKSVEPGSCSVSQVFVHLYDIFLLSLIIFSLGTEGCLVLNNIQCLRVISLKTEESWAHISVVHL